MSSSLSINFSSTPTDTSFHSTQILLRNMASSSIIARATTPPGGRGDNDREPRDEMSAFHSFQFPTADICSWQVRNAAIALHSLIFSAYQNILHSCNGVKVYMWLSRLQHEYDDDDDDDHDYRFFSQQYTMTSICITS